MMYKTIVLELLRQRTELHDQLKSQRLLMPCLNALARELKTSHEHWKQTLAGRFPEGPPPLIASEAMELAIKELEDRLPSVLPKDDSLSLDAAMAHLRTLTSRN